MSCARGGTLLALVALLVCVASTAFAGPVLRERWTCVETDPFRIYGDGPAPEVKRLARDLETFRSVVLQILPGVEAAPQEQVVVFAFQDGWTLRRYPLREDDPRLGTALTTAEGAWIQLLASPGQAARAIAYHEYAHYLIRRNAPSLPTWLNEGLASHYGTFQVFAGGEIQLGGPDNLSLGSYQYGIWLPFDEVLRKRGTRGAHRSGALLYVESWAFVQYAISVQPELMEALPAYLERVQAGEDEGDAFEGAFGFTTEELDRRLDAYLAGNRFGAFRFRLADSIERPKLVARRVPTAEVGVEMALQRLAARAATPLTRRLLERALKLDPGNPRATAALAEVAWREGELDEAERLFDEALAAAPEDPIVLYLAGVGARDEAERATEPERKAELRLEARELLRAAAVADPTLLSAAARYADTLLAPPEGDLEDGIAVLTRSLQLRPGDPEAAYVLQVLYMKAGRFDEAREVFHRLVRPAASPRLLEHAREVLERVTGAD